MEFRNLHKQYKMNEQNINMAVKTVLESAHFIQGNQVRELEEKLAEYVGVRHCITCANGTDALQLALMTWNIGKGDIVFVPDFTFFSSGEVVAALGAIPEFVDVDINTYNIDCHKLEAAVKNVIKEGKGTPRAIIAVDLFGQPADYNAIREIAGKYNLYILEDAAQGFGGSIGEKKACSFGDISTTSFFPAKPLGCYGDGGAIFTNNDDWMRILKSLAVHGKGESKYDNIRIGMNSRLDTLQAGILLEKFPVFQQYELERSAELAAIYESCLKDIVKVPVVRSGYDSSWAQYTIQTSGADTRRKLQEYLKSLGIPTAIYYQKPMHEQKAFSGLVFEEADFPVTNELCKKVLSLPFHPYMEVAEVEMVAEKIKEYVKANG